MRVIKRNGAVVDFEPARIQQAIQSAYQAAGVEPGTGRYNEVTEEVLRIVSDSFNQRAPHVEEIQDIVERQLVHFDQYTVSKKYILYREKQRERRERDLETRHLQAESGSLQVKRRSGRFQHFDSHKIVRTIERLAGEYIDDISVEAILYELPKNIFDGIPTSELEHALILSTTALIERDPAYSRLAARMLLQVLYRQAMGDTPSAENFDGNYRASFVATINQGIKQKIFTESLSGFNLNTLATALQPQRDSLFTYIGIQTLYERYFVRLDGSPAECPQGFWMRVAMGLAIDEKDRDARAIEYYEMLSTMRFVCSTPTLFHSGLVHPQLSSCYLSTVKDDLTSIFKVFGDNAQLSKWSGGIGNDWTPIRATGAFINSTHVESQGVVPFLKIANDTTVAINRSGKRRGATCAYLETWHLDIEDFLDLRRNTGDDRRRTHDMNTANWIPDLFMQRVRQNGTWTLFSPDETPDLHDLWGRAFAERYQYYEERAAAGELHRYREIDAVKLWRKMLTRLFETGHPWITFKDPCNIRSPQDHCGVVHNSNLCTEVILNNSPDETAVCNIGSINLARHMVDDESSETGKRLSLEMLEETVYFATRMLDNVIDLNYYPTKEARASNSKHRPVGLGMMGFQDVLFMLRIPFADERAKELADKTMEFVSYHTILSSSKLARERGAYGSYKGSKWDRGIFPIDTLELLAKERGATLRVDTRQHMDWKPVRAHVAKYGMRNSNTMAIAPTATISNISGCFPCIEPIYKNLYVKANMNGEFTIVNTYLVNDLKRLNLWDEQMREEMKYFDGSIDMIDRIPQEIKDLYKVSFDIDPHCLIDLTAVRGKWIDQSQSHNVFIKGSSGKQLNDIYMHAWESGLKTTYYLRSLAVSQIEKSTLNVDRYGYTQKRDYAAVEQPTPAVGEHAAAAELAPVPPAAAPPAPEGTPPQPGTTPSMEWALSQTQEANGNAGAVVDEADDDQLAIDTDSDEVLAIKACKIDDPDCEACQ